MKIAMVIDAWGPIVGGGQVHVRNLCEKLIKNHNCEIDLFVRALKGDDGEIFDKDEILFNGKLRILRCGRPKNFFNFFERILSIFSIFFRIIKENKNKKYDLIHAHAFLGLLIGKISSIVLNKPIIGTVHGANLLEKGEKSFYYFVEKFLLTQLKYDIQISVGSSFLKYPNVNNNIKIIGNGVNLEEFEKVNAEKNNNIFKIIFVGRLEWTKGVDILIEAINKIDRKLLDEKKVEIHLIGYGYQENDYKNLVKKYKLEKYILFRGKITGKNLIKQYKSGNLFILPSRTEGFPITILEAMSSKICILSSNCGSIKDILINGYNGFLVEKENSLELSEIIKKFINGEIKNLDEILEFGYQTVKNNYTWDIIAKKTYEEYNNLKN